MDLDGKSLPTRLAVLGDAYVDGALAKASPFTEPLQALVTRHAWGNTWQRTGIDLRTRSIVNVSMLVALGCMHELTIHLRGALHNGVTKEELQEIFLHASVYCGFPAAVDAFRAAAEGYARALPAGEGRPPFLVVVDVGHVIELYAEFTRSGATYTPFPDARSHRITLADLEARFTARGRWRERLPTILDTLVALGRARAVSDQEMRWSSA